MADRIIVPIGGGKFCDGAAEFLVGLTGKERPRLLYIGTASAEAPDQALRNYDRFGRLAEVSRLEFFPWPPEDLRTTVLEQDLIFVGGGSTANMLAIWRLHGVDALLREALEAGVVLSGSSAGGICWFEHGVTDSFGPQLERMECLGFLQGSFCPHWDDEEQRRPRYHELLAEGFPAGYAADAGVGLHFVNGELQGAVGCDEGTSAYRLEVVEGEVVEAPIPTRIL
ncbi:MAG TPA: peptidase E [Gaiellaceae bacterium]|nr:peptidase E [Gaiellaceae bacterium]